MSTMDSESWVSTVAELVAADMELAMVAEEEKVDIDDEVDEEVVKMVHMDSSINMENHSIMVLILIILN